MNLVIRAAMGLVLLGVAGAASAQRYHRDDYGDSRNRGYSNYGYRDRYRATYRRDAYGDRCGDYTYYDPHYAHELDLLNRHLDEEERAFLAHDRYENDPDDIRHREADYRAFQQHRREEIRKFLDHQRYEHGRDH